MVYLRLMAELYFEFSFSWFLLLEVLLVLHFLAVRCPLSSTLESRPAPGWAVFQLKQIFNYKCHVNILSLLKLIILSDISIFLILLVRVIFTKDSRDLDIIEDPIRKLCLITCIPHSSVDL